MQIAVLYVSTALIFLIVDAIGLSTMIKPLFEKHVGGMLLDAPRYGPAAAFYLFYVAGLLFFVTVPGLREGTGLGVVALQALFFGAVAYGTYEFSNLATLKGWSWSMVAADLAWGSVLTAGSAVAGLAIARAVG